MKYLLRGLAVGLVFVLLSGCATTRSHMSLDVPHPSSRPTSSNKVVVLGSIQDARTFEADPADPSTPSLKKGSEYALNATQRKQAIARKRGGFGHAFGDILLDKGQTVETIMRQLLTQAFAERGYKVVDASNAPASAPHVDVDIHKFWAWFTPGFFRASIEARLNTLVKIDSPDGKRRVTVKGYGINYIQVGREANWRLAYTRAFKDYLKQFDNAAANNDL